MEKKKQATQAVTFVQKQATQAVTFIQNRQFK